MAFWGHLALVFSEPSILKLKSRLTYREYAYWRYCYFPKYGLVVNDHIFTWTPASDTPDTDKMERMVKAFGGVPDKELIEKFRSIERGQSESDQ